MLDKFYNLWAYNRFDTLPSLDRLMGRMSKQSQYQYRAVSMLMRDKTNNASH